VTDKLKSRLEAAEKKVAGGGEAGFGVYDQSELVPLLETLGRSADEAAQAAAAATLTEDPELWQAWLASGHSPRCIVITGDDRFL
jgi:hypothetical protein